jgi:hypothetical protein
VFQIDKNDILHIERVCNLRSQIIPNYSNFGCSNVGDSRKPYIPMKKAKGIWVIAIRQHNIGQAIRMNDGHP